jgi:hypothetical protein
MSYPYEHTHGLTGYENAKGGRGLSQYVRGRLDIVSADCC